MTERMNDTRSGFLILDIRDCIWLLKGFKGNLRGFKDIEGFEGIQRDFKGSWRTLSEFNASEGFWWLNRILKDIKEV